MHYVPIIKLDILLDTTITELLQSKKVKDLFLVLYCHLTIT